MRSALMIPATAAASAALVFRAPDAYAAGSDLEHDDSSYTRGSSDGKDHDMATKEPLSGMHTGGGALTAVNDRDDWGSSRDPKTDPDTYKDDGGGKGDWGGSDRDSGGRGNDSWGGGGHE